MSAWEIGGNANIYSGQITMNGSVQQIIPPNQNNIRRVLIINNSTVTAYIGPPVQPAIAPTPGAALSATNGVGLITLTQLQLFGPRNNGLSVIGASGTLSFIVETT